MKKVLITMLAVVILACGLMIFASAADYENLADDLSTLGLFRGTGSGYDLDRAPNRGESLVMLIRLLGLEEDALACESEHPFTDVDEWLSPYVAFAFENELTTGVSETVFGSGLNCTAQMYVTFVLRALGYGEDFEYDDAIDFGVSIGVIDSILDADPFLRDHLVAVSYLALFAEPKDGDFGSLLEKLIAEGAVDAEAAADILAKFALLAEMALVGSELDGVTSMAMIMSMDAEMSMLGQAMVISVVMDMSMVMDDLDITAAITMDLEAAGESQSMEMYITGGFIYINADGDKIKMDAGLDDMSGLLEMADVGGLALNPLYLITGISKDTEGDFIVYSVTLADGVMSSAMSQILGLMGDVGLGDLGLGEIAISIPEMKIFAGQDGSLKKIVITIDMSVAMDMGGVVMAIPISMSMEIEITAIGDDVTVTLPDDLDEYVLAEEPEGAG